jgi:hypothetical protein
MDHPVDIFFQNLVLDPLATAGSSSAAGSPLFSQTEADGPISF